MAKDNRIDIPVPTFDDLFKSTKPEEVVKEKVVTLKTKDIVPFPNHPFKVKDLEMEEMVESIRNIGVNTPITVRKGENGEYQIISGHRRKRACDILGIKEIPCIIRDLSKDEAIIQMVDSNIQREKILPSEKAFAYKMKLEALKNQGKRTDLGLIPVVNSDEDILVQTNCLGDRKFEQELENSTSCQVGTKLNSAEKTGEDNKDSPRQVYRFIRLTELIPDLLEMVDNEKIAFNPAVELSYLAEEEQYVLLDIMQCLESTPSLAQAIRFKKLSQEGNLTESKIEEIMFQKKANQQEKYKITYDKFTKYIPREVVTPNEVENYLLRCAIACKQMGIRVDNIRIDDVYTKTKSSSRER